MPNYLCHERFFDFKVVCLYCVTVTKKYNPIEVNIFSKQYHYFSCFESGVSEAKVASRKTLGLLLRNIQTSWISPTLR